jgi:hypothetical protein
LKSYRAHIVHTMETYVDFIAEDGEEDPDLLVWELVALIPENDWDNLGLEIDTWEVEDGD